MMEEKKDILGGETKEYTEEKSVTEEDVRETKIEEIEEVKKPTEKPKKHKVLKRVIIIIFGVVALLMIGYIIMLLLVTGSLDRFGVPFSINNGRVYFMMDSCSSDEVLDCCAKTDSYSECSCEEKRDSDEYIDDKMRFYLHQIVKPIIYLYPESVVDLRVTLGNPSLLTASYPKYTDGWEVTAYPNGDLVDRESGKKLYALYWEGQRKDDEMKMETGFVVEGEKSAEFLEEKLSILGLNYKEKEEFIVYWLPKLEANKYNYIYFSSMEEINEWMPLEFSVKPETVIRVNMVFKGLDEYREVKEQVLQPAPERKGFTAVEWGGTVLGE